MLIAPAFTANEAC